ncbi:GrpB family protein [Myxococcus stipitatus]|uniref:GrpB family protein n=1 Tax=Myxococcus stipitatus TaxID=83455 RepID=UPI0030D4AA68
MPPPIRVELFPHDARWADEARTEALALAKALGPDLLRVVHHVGSTAIPGIHAKPILDLMPVVTDLAALDGRQERIEALGYEWWGELGLPGRRYCTKADAVTGRRVAQLHCYREGSPEVVRHLAFRDYLRQHPEVAAAYDEEKARCRNLHPDDSHAYSDSKNAWIQRAEAEALAWYRRTQG